MRMTASWFGLTAHRIQGPSEPGGPRKPAPPLTRLSHPPPRFERRAQGRQGRSALLRSALRASLTAPGKKSGRTEEWPDPAEQRNEVSHASSLTSQFPYKCHVA